MSVDLPQVPEDAPPAVLFRLSYRTDNTARGGFRDSDSGARVVDAMRGWWELNPEDIKALNIKYAVAFHDGGSGSPNDPYTYIRALLTNNESPHFDQAFNGISQSSLEARRQTTLTVRWFSMGADSNSTTGSATNGVTRVSRCCGMPMRLLGPHEKSPPSDLRPDSHACRAVAS
ncbi:hypothetical protein [Candidatus Poriferisodalis sp.]|uniref:hypothetical protein n=1 Tax=Candidatus Poriferisodalis sp. TaxID=3101277 RepID=UPI003C6F2DA3